MKIPPSGQFHTHMLFDGRLWRVYFRSWTFQSFQFDWNESYEFFANINFFPRRKCILKGWEKARVTEIANSDKPLPPVDPFEEIYQA